jgi:hypothetical protein
MLQFMLQFCICSMRITRILLFFLMPSLLFGDYANIAFEPRKRSRYASDVDEDYELHGECVNIKPEAQTNHADT